MQQMYIATEASDLAVSSQGKLLILNTTLRIPNLGFRIN